MNHILTIGELDEHRWASCGPASLAALLHRPLSEIRHAFPHHTEAKTWTNFQMMGRALARLGVKHEHTGQDEAAQMSARLNAYGSENPKRWPVYGLAILQFVGSWSTMSVNHPAQLERAHWVAISPLLGVDGAPRSPALPMVFDINLLDDLDVRFRDHPVSHGWTTRAAWAQVVAPVLAKSYGTKATGGWWVRGGIEVRA